MSKSIFIDSSYILALVNTHDEFHKIAKRLANEINTKLVTTEAILVEIGNALSRLQWRELSIATLSITLAMV